MKFKIDVSRVYKNKDGYSAGGYKLNTSFVTEEHTPESFIDSVIKQGWPYTFHHAKRPPKETGAAGRGVTTPKHTENFLSLQVLTFDDDSKAPNVVNGWLGDKFFSQYGFAFVESVNSESGTAEKGHPTIILDAPITDPELAKECLEAFLYRHKRLDPLKNIDRTIYNAEGARVHLLGNICPFVVYEQYILKPYRKYLATKEREALEIEIRRQVEFENAPQSEIDDSDDAIRIYIQKSLDGIFDYVSRTASGRNGLINWAGYRVAGLQKAHWTSDHQDLFTDVEQRIADAAAVNGYSSEYGHGKSDEAVRIFNLGYAANKSDYADKPMLRIKQQPKQEVTHEYLRGYKEGWLDGFQSGLAVGRKYWNALSVSDSMIALYGLGYSPEKEALTVPYYDWNNELLNIEYQHIDGNFEYEQTADSFYITDPTNKSGRYTFITHNTLSAMRGYVSAANSATAVGVDTPLVLGLPHERITADYKLILDEIDSGNFVFVAPHGLDIDPSIVKALRGKCKFLRLPVSFEQMIKADGLNWIEWMLPKAVS